MAKDEKTIKETLLKGERMTLECKKVKAEVQHHGQFLITGKLSQLKYT
ncbi:MAG: hypothetical protein J6I37_03990 [Prevotella sp.]|nr:hypothetical protein [Prevotella sp.]